MATSLLLEGEDLEELLTRARAEGGPDARIVRADKVRRGGVKGFFARELYEVVIEVPDGTVLDGAVPAPGGSGPAVPDDAAPDQSQLSPAERLAARRQRQLGDPAQVGTFPAPPAPVEADEPAEFTAFGSPFEAALAAARSAIERDAAAEVVDLAADEPVVPEAVVPEAVVPEAVAPDPDTPAAAEVVVPETVAPEPVPAVEASTPAEPEPVPEPTLGEAIAAGGDAVRVVVTGPAPQPADEAVAPDNDVIEVQLPPVVTGLTLAEPARPEEILGQRVAPTAVAWPDGDPLADAERPRHGRRAVSVGTYDPTCEMLDPVLAVERAASRSIAGQPLSDPEDFLFQVPVNRSLQRGTTDPAWEAELARAAQSAAYAAVYAAVHSDGVVGVAAGPYAHPSRAASFAPVDGAGRVPAPRSSSGSYASAGVGSPARSPEWGTAEVSGIWQHVPTHALMVTGFSGDESQTGSVPSTRPEFAALLNQLRGIDEQAPRPAESWSAAPTWQAPVEPYVAEPFVAEPIVAEPYVAEPVETLAVDPAPTWSAPGDSWTAPGDASGFDTSTVRGPQLGDTEADLDFVETIRRQAQAAIDHAFGAGAMAQEAQRMQEAAAAIPLPRAGVPEASVPIAFDASPLPPLGFAVEVTDEIADAVEHLPDDDARLVADRATLVALGVPQTWAATLRSGDRYSAVWQMLENLPPLDVDPDAPVVAVVGSPDVARLEAHRVAIDLAEGMDPRPVIVVPATGETQVGAPNQACVVAIETDGTGDPSQVLETLGAIRPDVVLVVLDAATPQAEARRWLFSLGAVDGIALDGVAIANQPAALLGLGVPVTRLDGIPIDRMTWTALLCAQLEAARPAI